MFTFKGRQALKVFGLCAAMLCGIALSSTASMARGGNGYEWAQTQSSTTSAGH